MVLDEPRQQETDLRSLAAFFERLNRDRNVGQVLYATSEDPKVLDQLLSNIPHTTLPAFGPHLLILDSGPRLDRAR
jgi:hypothetical protein